MRNKIGRNDPCPCKSGKKYKKCCLNIQTIPQEKLDTMSNFFHERAQTEYEEFKKKLILKKCYLCDLDFEVFNKEKPCIHWFLRPSGFTKKDIPLIFMKYGYHQIQSYLRWLANSEIPFKNINDLVEEKNSSKFIENTITYKNYEWSFSCSPNDFEGHKGSQFGKMPHYHFQMKIDSNIFISYGEYHFPFNKEDEFFFQFGKGKFKQFKHTFGHGAGMQEILDMTDPNKLLDSIESTDNETQGTFKLDTFLEADDGHTISGDTIAELINERKRTGKPFAKLADKIKNIKIRTIITPGPGVPEIAGRKGGRGSRKGN